jgi:hypothetical protein
MQKLITKIVTKVEKIPKKYEKTIMWAPAHSRSKDPNIDMTLISLLTGFYEFHEFQ